MNEHAKNLRRTRADMLGTEDNDHYLECQRAAAYIEQLEAALLKIRNHPEEDGVADSMEAIARAALEGKHDAGPDGYCGKLSSKLGLQAGETE